MLDSRDPGPKWIPGVNQHEHRSISTIVRQADGLIEENDGGDISLYPSVRQISQP